MIQNDNDEEEELSDEDFVMDSLEQELYESLCREPMPYVRTPTFIILYHSVFRAVQPVLEFTTVNTVIWLVDRRSISF